jgi:hypothetical protein
VFKLLAYGYELPTTDVSTPNKQITNNGGGK